MKLTSLARPLRYPRLKPQFRRAHAIPEAVTRITTLPSGLRVATEHRSGVTATVGVYVDAGSGFEDDANNGVAHFLEHMAFKGTTKRSKSAIEREVENIGATLNAYTTREQTAYVVQCFKQDIPQMVDLLSDIIQNSTFKHHLIESERSTIITEKHEVEKDVDEVIYDYLHMGAFSGTSLGLTILGQPPNIKKIQKADLVRYIATHYTTARTVIVGAGAVDHDQLVDLASQHFAKLPITKPEKTAEDLDEIPWTPAYVIDPNVGKPDEARVSIAFQAVPWIHPHYFSLQVIQTLLGDWDYQIYAGEHLRNRLAQVLAAADIEGLKSVKTFQACYHKTGLIGFNINASPENVDQVVFTVLETLATLPEWITDEILEIAKIKVKIATLQTLDGSLAVADEIAKQVLTTGHRLTSSQVAQRVDCITREHILDCLNYYFDDVCPVVVALGGVDNVPPYHEIRKRTDFGFHQS